MAAPTNQELIDFVIREARLIDMHRLDEWLEPESQRVPVARHRDRVTELITGAAVRCFHEDALTEWLITAVGCIAVTTSVVELLGIEAEPACREHRPDDRDPPAHPPIV